MVSPRPAGASTGTQVPAPTRRRACSAASRRRIRQMLTARDPWLELAVFEHLDLLLDGAEPRTAQLEQCRTAAVAVQQLIQRQLAVFHALRPGARVPPTHLRNAVARVQRPAGFVVGVFRAISAGENQGDIVVSGPAGKALRIASHPGSAPGRESLACTRGSPVGHRSIQSRPRCRGPCTMSDLSLTRDALHRGAAPSCRWPATSTPRCSSASWNLFCPGTRYIGHDLSVPEVG